MKDTLLGKQVAITFKDQKSHYKHQISLQKGKVQIIQKKTIFDLWLTFGQISQTDYPKPTFSLHPHDSPCDSSYIPKKNTSSCSLCHATPSWCHVKPIIVHPTKFTSTLQKTSTCQLHKHIISLVMRTSRYKHTWCIFQNSTI